jgi:xylulokinase
LGAAFLALVGTGAFATLSEASEHIVKIRECIEPDPANESVYTEAYQRYRQTYFATLPVFEATAKHI